MSHRLYLDIHILQNTPPSCINRDDTGSPKTAIYGGVIRARVSSQAWKRAVRVAFRDTLGRESLGERTKRIIPMVAEEIQKLDPSADSMKLAREVLKSADIGIKSSDEKKKDDKKDQEGTGALFFMSHRQAEALANLAVFEPEKLNKPENVKTVLQSAPSIDMALFGRMVANDPSLNVDAACQVAHAISTHLVRNEFDYFTAVDDRLPKDTSGAGHIGTNEFNSSVLYRYATVNIMDLVSQLGKEEAEKAVLAFTDAFIRSMPTGKQNTFANRTLPDVVYICLRTDQPLNLVGAFEKPVKAGANGMMESSVLALRDYERKICDKYDMPPVVEFDLGGEITGQPTVGLQKMLSEIQRKTDELIEVH